MAHRGHFTTGHSKDRIDSTLPAVRNPKMVPWDACTTTFSNTRAFIIAITPPQVTLS
jgi:hypothetical protein